MVSGVICAFRKRALDEAGWWSPRTITDDIDVTWRLQCAGWPVPHEPYAIVCATVASPARQCGIIPPFAGHSHSRRGAEPSARAVMLDVGRGRLVALLQRPCCCR
jgi:hypothetical protein